MIEEKETLPQMIFDLVIEKVEGLGALSEGSEIKYKSIVRDIKRNRETVIESIKGLLNDYFDDADNSDSGKNSLKITIAALQTVIMVLSGFINIVKSKEDIEKGTI